jgi:TPR repeat protein
MLQFKDRLVYTCPFCRYNHSAKTKTFEESERKRYKMKRMEANDPVEIQRMGSKHYDEGDYSGAFEYWTKAAGFGDIDAHFSLSVLYREGTGVEKDDKMGLYHLEEAAIAGHPRARHNLAIREWRNGRIDRAMKHYIIAANLGLDESIQSLKECYVHGEVSKGDFATALRARQAAKDEMKSPQREAAAKAEAAGKVPWIEI